MESLESRIDKMKRPQTRLPKALPPPARRGHECADSPILAEAVLTSGEPKPSGQTEPRTGWSKEPRIYDQKKPSH